MSKALAILALVAVSALATSAATELADGSGQSGSGSDDTTAAPEAPVQTYVPTAGTPIPDAETATAATGDPDTPTAGTPIPDAETATEATGDSNVQRGVDTATAAPTVTLRTMEVTFAVNNCEAMQQSEIVSNIRAVATKLKSGKAELFDLARSKGECVEVARRRRQTEATKKPIFKVTLAFKETVTDVEVAATVQAANTAIAAGVFTVTITIGGKEVELTLPTDAVITQGTLEWSSDNVDPAGPGSNTTDTSTVVAATEDPAVTPVIPKAGAGGVLASAAALTASLLASQLL